MYFYQNCRSVYNFWCLLPSTPSSHKALDNSHNSKFCITRYQTADLRFGISTMYFYQNCRSVYNFWCLLPSTPSSHMALESTEDRIRSSGSVQMIPTLPFRLSNHMALDNTQVTQASTLRDRKPHICGLRSPPCIF